MNPFETLSALPRQLRHPAVRDLAWALASPPLLARCAWPQRHPLQGSGWASEPGLLVRWLHSQDAHPAALHAFLAMGPIRRLGVYYERLWQFALAAAPGIDVLAAGLPVREGGRTLGEFDLLLRDYDGIHHVELAVKFYLGPADGQGRAADAWLGPGCHDRLGQKLRHLGEQQLRLGGQPAALPTLLALGAEHPAPALWLGGYLFYPWPAGGNAPAGAHPAHLRGAWLHRRYWQALARGLPQARWAPLPRARWFAPATAEVGLSGAELDAWLDSLAPLVQAEMVLRIGAQGEELERLFVVPDAWPHLPRRY